MGDDPSHYHHGDSKNAGVDLGTSQKPNPLGELILAAGQPKTSGQLLDSVIRRRRCK